MIVIDYWFDGIKLLIIGMNNSIIHKSRAVMKNKKYHTLTCIIECYVAGYNNIKVSFATLIKNIWTKLLKLTQ
jgi:hypothetical protein